MILFRSVYFFFFQAEDGIRDIGVTGVQTCALPIWEVYLNGGRVNTGRDAISWLVEGERRGAGEFVLNSIDADGTETGYDLDFISAVAEKTSLPIVASGGAGGPEHLIAAVKIGRAHA